MKCPGQDWRYWREDAIFEVKCPYCGASIEFFKDDTVRKCSQCKKAVPNPRMDFGCAAYCKYAEVCLGELPPELIREKANLLKTRLLTLLQELLDKESFSRIEKGAELLEEELRSKEQSPGTKLLLFYFYFLTPDQREELYKKANLPETLWEEIRHMLKGLPADLTQDALIETLIKD
ncbi:phosphohydrolase [Caldimicrobium thiodismutans]|uniref:Phosphohydrolase n=1 Tax=Caldimicrobium thiodismutans TaxID=1653476 RepID=A0A0U5AL58_9BACT|nr:hypothetical protein [Caldimicrobium thiodismutans]BAU22804.1 phosphohydrolase [Caldimicrobium thiodismutans]